MSRMAKHFGGASRRPQWANKVLGAYIALTLACVVIVAPFVDYACRHGRVVRYGWLLFLAAFAVCGLLAVVYSRLRRMELGARRFAALSLGMGLVLFAAQLYLEKSAGFSTGWDVLELTRVGDRAPSDGILLRSYFSVYPNQLFLFGLFHKIASAASLLGAEVSTYRLLTWCGCLCVTTSIVLTSFVCRRLFGEVRALFFQVFASLFLGMSGWVLVPYSDAYGMLFTCAALWFYVVPRRRASRLSGVVAASLMGYMVKPTVIFVLLAVALLDWAPRAVRTVRDDLGAARGRTRATSLRAALAKAIGVVVPVLLGAVLAFGLGRYVKGDYVDLDPNASRSMAHFLAMGINPETKGVFSREDNDFSTSIYDPDERQAAQIALWEERLSELGPLGVAKMWFEKNLTNYADGTFAWGNEGNFVMEVTGDSDAVKDWLGIVEGSLDVPDDAFAYGCCCQVLWFVVLLGCAASAFRRGSGPAVDASDFRPSTNLVCAVMALALIFLSGFLLIFECRARYLFLYSPYFVLLPIGGLIGEGSVGERLAKLLGRP